MQGVTTAIVAFILLCIAYPQLIKNRPQLNAALGLILLVIFFDCIGNFSTIDGSLRRLMYFINAILQIGSVLLLVASTGGRTLSELRGDVSKTIDVVRRGGEKETIIVPLKGEQPKSRDFNAPRTPRPAADDSSIEME